MTFLCNENHYSVISTVLGTLSGTCSIQLSFPRPVAFPGLSAKVLD